MNHPEKKKTPDVVSREQEEKCVEGKDNQIILFIFLIGFLTIHGTEHKYEGAQEALKSGVISGGNMTSETAYTKLLRLLSNKNRYDVKQVFKENVAGELS